MKGGPLTTFGSFIICACAAAILATGPLASAEPLKLGPGGSAGTKPAPVDPATAAARAKLISGAIQALSKEYQAYLKDPKTGKLRDKPTYFKDNASPEATPDAIIRGLEQTISGGRSLEAYVKWQLLSGIPDKFPDDLVKRAVAVYKRAPAPFEHPGLARRELTSATSRVKKDELAGANKDFAAAVENISERNHPILEYRDELYARIPKTSEALVAGMSDVADRAGSGLNANKFFDNVSAGLRSWAITEGKASTVRGMADMVANLKTAVNRDENKPYTKLEDVKGVIKWKADATIDVKKLDELLKFLDQTASSPTGGGLKFKDK